MAMSKKDLIEDVAQQARINKAEAKRAIETVALALTEQLRTNGRALFAHVGVFTVKLRKARQGVNPQTGKPLDIPAMKVVKFTPARDLKEMVKKF